MRAMQDPQRYFTELMNQSGAMQDPRAQSAMQMLQNHDTQGLKSMAENMCREYGTTPDEMQRRINQFIGM